jgi:hypothetical protein
MGVSGGKKGLLLLNLGFPSSLVSTHPAFLNARNCAGCKMIGDIPIDLPA